MDPAARLNILFICSRNQWRSRTAETIFRDNTVGHKVRSAGTSRSARITVTEDHIRWADCIFVMEPYHKAILQERFRKQLRNKELIVLDIEDRYDYMHEELIRELRESVGTYLDLD